jgi:uncharacterized membrane protein YoaK (UPF0700 family)
MADKIIAPLAMLLFATFVAFLAIYINEIDLWIVIVVVVAMGVVDFWQTLRSENGKSGG